MSYRTYKRKVAHNRMTKFEKLDILAKLSVKYSESSDEAAQAYDNGQDATDTVLKGGDNDNGVTHRRYNCDIRYMKDENEQSGDKASAHNEANDEITNTTNELALTDKNQNGGVTDEIYHANDSTIKHKLSPVEIYSVNECSRSEHSVGNFAEKSSLRKHYERYGRKQKAYKRNCMVTVQDYRSMDGSYDVKSAVTSSHDTHALQEEYKMTNLKVNSNMYRPSRGIYDDDIDDMASKNSCHNTRINDMSTMKHMKKGPPVEFLGSSTCNFDTNDRFTDMFCAKTVGEERALNTHRFSNENISETGWMRGRKTINKYSLCHIYGNIEAMPNYVHNELDIPVTKHSFVNNSAPCQRPTKFYTSRGDCFQQQESIADRSGTKPAHELRTLYAKFKTKLKTYEYNEYRNLDYLIIMIEDLSERKKKSQKNTLSNKAKKILHSKCELRRRTAINLGLLAISDFIDKTTASKRNKKKIIFGALQLILKLKLESLSS